MEGLNKNGRFVGICKRNADDSGEKGVLINYFGLVLASGQWPIFIGYDLISMSFNMASTNLAGSTHVRFGSKPWGVVSLSAELTENTL
jgi:hypothetical protein